MPFDPAEPRPIPAAPAGRNVRPRRAGAWAVAGLVLCLVAAGGAVLLIRHPQPALSAGHDGRPERLGAARPAPGQADDGAGGRPGQRAEASTALLRRLVAYLRSGSAARASQLSAPGDQRAQVALRTLRHNVRVLGVDHLSLRYLGEQASGSLPAGRGALDRDAWVAEVSLGWRLRGFDAHDSRIQVPITLRGHGGRTSFVSFPPAASGQVEPLWLLQRLSAARRGRSLVLGDPAAVRRYSPLAQQAAVDVRRVLTGWHGRLVVEVPASSALLARALGATAGEYDEIAAVTTTEDGSRRRSAPVRIIVNPVVLGPLGPRGSQVVMSHEATHVATHAALSSMPPWLLEGFADYVALARSGIPVRAAASQALALVRRDGPPGHLPGPAEFDAHDARLGASYESAWLACRLLAQRYGQRRLVRFYRSSQRATSTTAAFRALGTSRRAFTQAWRADLRRLAR